jgi:pyocin large subunit-like protein
MLGHAQPMPPYSRGAAGPRCCAAHRGVAAGDARQTIAKHGLDFPVGHDADADAVATTGAFVNDAPRYLQSTGMSGTLAEREQRAFCRISEAGCVRRG